MDNRTLAKSFDLMAKLMELHDQNPFKIRTYANAFQSVARSERELIDLDFDDLVSIPGIGKTLAQNIIELSQTGRINALNELISITPEGLLEILKIKGLGAKKIRMIWRELGVESLGELEYACLENRLITLKGFGEKTQNDILQQIGFIKKAKGTLLLSQGLLYSANLMNILNLHFPENRFEFAGALRRKMEVIEAIDLVGTVGANVLKHVLEEMLDFSFQEQRIYFANLPFNYHECNDRNFESALHEMTLPNELRSLKSEADDVLLRSIPPECLDLYEENSDRTNDLANLVHLEDIKGIIHAHSRWSDGRHSLEDMAAACIQMGYQYLVITDHSASAFYANGLNEDRVLNQWDEIDKLNLKWQDFKIFKGIESDILNDGRLDYSDDFIKGFDVVIASVHSVLKMDEKTANARLIRAIEHPATRILGHPTGRLLLSRPGYPIDHRKIIDACAANKVVIEINSNPHRLDIDWRWMPYALKRGVNICLSPDAHQTEGIPDIDFGVWMARKGWVPKKYCLNVKDKNEFESWIQSK